MTKNLDSIPYDVFYQVASKLDCHDYIHLSRVNRSLNAATKSDSIARNTVKGDLLHTKEGKEADQAKAGYRKAIGRLYDIKESFATAQPYSASVLGYGSAFLFTGGSLCYIYNDEIRALNVRGASRVEQVLNLPNVLRRAIPGCNPENGMARVSLMNYNEGVVAFLVEIDDRREAWLLAVDLKRRPSYGKSGRLRLRVQLESTERLFVRHNGSYLYYGTHSAVGTHGHTQWEVNCADLKTMKTQSENMIVLDKFAGYEIGQTVCFEVYQNHLYAISTLVDFEEEEIDWTSYYVWICLDPRLQIPKEGVKPHRTWRRQHREGPINDTWSDLSLRQDESSGQLMILECRREWRDGGSENCRTYYIQPLPAPADVDKQQPPSDYYQMPALPDEPLAKLLDSSNKPNYERPLKRLRRHYHQEYEGSIEPKPRRDFILAKTKFRTYNLSASSYLDLVNDPLPSGGGRGGDLVPRDRVRLRMVSRKRKCPIDEESGLLFTPELSEADGRPVENSEERFTSRGVHLWPPDDAPQELNHLLCPSKRTGQVQATADERSIVYSVNKDGLQPGDQAIIFINFDPCLRLPGHPRLNLGSRLGEPEKTETAVGIERPHVGDVGQQERAAMHTTVADKRANQNVPAVREERAMYLDIGQGFWFR
ncbi:F-box domain protein [Aspergillus lucknowensis]|uniref:F-box domain protein n=1 Tax=Aspergillus lucknowensis TaxID=176173 RepID=A0ABR4LS64_9EURO